MVQQKETVPVDYRLVGKAGQDACSLRLTTISNGLDVEFTFEAILPGIFRTTFTSTQHPLPPFPSARIPTRNLKGCAFIDRPSTRSSEIRFKNIKGSVSFDTVPLVSLRIHDGPALYEDLPFRSYSLDGPGVAQYTKHHRGSLHVGLGEKAAPMDLSGRCFTLSATDCFGYDALRTDPMYKHVPLLVRATPQGVAATFSTTHARGFYSVGSEMDGMWGFYNVYRQDYGGLEQYILLGQTLQEVVSLYATLVGHPLLVPRWAFGYLAGGMKYSMLDEPRASEALSAFAQKLEIYDIPCSGFQLSSGYTVAETEPKTRNVFTWNEHRFPNPEGFIQDFLKRGIRLIANVKPYVLASHPDYRKLVTANALFKDMDTGGAAIARLWSAGGGESGEGGHVDFTSKTGYDWWYNGVKTLRQQGIECIWNDNNEYVVPNDEWQCALTEPSTREGRAMLSHNKQYIGLWGRALHTELMAKSSHDAIREVAPHERPFVLTRSATAGTLRYCASSWSGDNVTSWNSMRGANAISLNAGVSLLHCYGHDIGGFEGPQPSPELLLRWIQLGIHSPRFAINCFKTGNDNLIGDVIEPWMYPDILQLVRRAIRRRYELIPYLYSLMLQSHRDALPPQRWVGWGYEKDEEVWMNKILRDGEQQYWLGDALMIGGVYEPGVDKAKIYLPKHERENPGFINTNAPYQHLEAGSWHTVMSHWRGSIPVIARIGSAVPVGRPYQTAAPGDSKNVANLPTDDWRAVEIFPPPAGCKDRRRYSSVWSEDDGISPASIADDVLATFPIRYGVTEDSIIVSVGAETTAYEPPWVKNGLWIILPVGETRRVALEEACVTMTSIEDSGEDDRGRQMYRIALAADMGSRE